MSLLSWYLPIAAHLNKQRPYYNLQGLTWLSPPCLSDLIYNFHWTLLHHTGLFAVPQTNRALSHLKVHALAISSLQRAPTHLCYWLTFTLTCNCSNPTFLMKQALPLPIDLKLQLAWLLNGPSNPSYSAISFHFFHWFFIF